MGVGPPGRTGRDQLETVRRLLTAQRPGPADVVVVACNLGSAVGADGRWMGSPVHSVSCGGSVHTSVLELILRSGAGGVLVVACPPRDCWNREGPKWLEQRVHHGREAELYERVDRRRVRIAYASQGETREALVVLREFRTAVTALQPPPAESAPDVERECDVPAGELA
jgi:coenzyme F420-reducing hydrogenase delta subunit